MPEGAAGFRIRLLLAMMVLATVIVISSLYIAERNLVSGVEADLSKAFEAELKAVAEVQALRLDALKQLSRALVRKPRIHAALEDNALDLLYPSARDELRDLMQGKASASISGSRRLDAHFYRFLDAKGAVIPPLDPLEAGELTLEAERKLALKSVPMDVQLGYLRLQHDPAPGTIAEVMTLPILSTETGEPIAALALGFKIAEQPNPTQPMRSGVWLENHLQLAGITDSARQGLNDTLSKTAPFWDSGKRNIQVQLDQTPHLLFFHLVNAGSMYAPAFEVSLFSLGEMLAKQRLLRWKFVAIGAGVLLIGFVTSHYLAARLSAPVAELEADSERQRAHRERAETALEQTSLELQRSVRFSADASHQLKTPLAVLRAGLDELQARNDLPDDVREEISGLIHQTYRLSGVIEDLLLLSRLDEGRLQLKPAAVDISQLLAAELDDLEVLPDPQRLEVLSEVAENLNVVGEARYTTMILRNVLENARKYNRPGGRIQVMARARNRAAEISVLNTGQPIPRAAREHIFERFHRAAAGENIPGHGLGLNLARELARLHGGDVKLVRSEEDRTEFLIELPLAQALHTPLAQPA